MTREKEKGKGGCCGQVGVGWGRGVKEVSAKERGELFADRA